MILRKAIFIVLIVFCLSPLGSPAAALVLQEWMFGTSVALLGFGTDLTTVYSGLKGGILFAFAGALVLLGFAYLVGRLLKVRRPLRMAMMLSPASKDEHKFFKVYLLINAFLLIAFTLIAAYWKLTPDQIGMWSAIAVPDAAAAVGVPQTLGRDAVNAAVPLVLARVLLITIFGWFLYKKEAIDRRTFPWFILVYILVTVLRTYAPVSIFPSVFDGLVNLGSAGVIFSLFLLGTRVDGTPASYEHVGED